jgi:hypothetical protein
MLSRLGRKLYEYLLSKEIYFMSSNSLHKTQQLKDVDVATRMFR